MTSNWYETNTGKKDAFASFVKNHEGRFHYLLYNRMDDLAPVISLYPDTGRMHEGYCNAISGNIKLLEYFSGLTPGNLANWATPSEIFTDDEMMAVASRFFFCSGVDKTDTTLETHICIGISGQEEFNAGRDLTLLEAFIFEAIFSYFKREKDPPFVKNFYAHAEQAGRCLKATFDSWDDFLTGARYECYEKMMEDEDLRKKLLKYYRKNKTNLNFIIVSKEA